MSDMVEDFKALAEFHAGERQERASVNLAELKRLNINAFEQSKNVFRIDSRDGAVMYYPTSGKWQHRGKTLRGSVEEFRAWLKKKHFLT